MSYGVNFALTKNIFKNIDVNVDVLVKQFVNLKGNYAEADASAEAIGKNTLTETVTQAGVVENFGSYSFSESVAATNDFYYYIG